jgi:phytol kinase
VEPIVQEPIADLIQSFDFPLAVFQVAVVGAWLLVVGGVAEGVRRATPASTEITRKIVHIGVGNVILLAWWLQTTAWMGISASVVFSAVALLSYRFPILPGINSVGRPSLGTFFYAVSVGLLTAWFWPRQQPEFAALGILTMTWGDGLAALVGQTWGRHRYELWGMGKSWEGSGTMAVVTGIVTWGVLTGAYGWQGANLAIAVLLAIAATTLEAFSRLGIDNLTVPLGTAALAFGLIHGWGSWGGWGG